MHSDGLVELEVPEPPNPRGYGFSDYERYLGPIDGFSNEKLFALISQLRTELVESERKVKQLEADMPVLTAKQKFMIRHVKDGDCGVRTDTHYCIRVDHKLSPDCEMAPFPPGL